MVRYKTVCILYSLLDSHFGTVTKIASEELEQSVILAILAVRQKMVRRITLKYVLT